MQNAESFRELVENPTEVLPLDLAVSLIAGVANESVQTTDIVTALDDLASRCNASNACELMTFLFGSGKFAGNTINFDEAENSLFDRLLERRLGIPISLCVLAIEVGRRKNIELLAIGMPGNFLVQNGQDKTQFFDPYRNAEPIDSQQCAALYRNLTSLDDWDDGFLRPVSNRMVIIRMLTNLKSIYARKNDIAGLRWVMRLRLMFPEIASIENEQWARLMRTTN